MIFLGDIAIGDSDKYPNVIGFPDSFKQDILIANLEGQIVPAESDYRNSMCLYNTSDGIQKLLNDFNIKAFGLANNHIFDISNSIKFTIERLNELKIKSFGVKSNDIEIDNCFHFKDNNSEVVVLNFGSTLVGCKDVKNNIVNKLTRKNVIEKLTAIKHNYPQSKVVLYLHWGIELEQIPTPTMRMLSKSFIDNGADLIIGSHPHCVMGYEKYMGKYIFYGLGNFLLQENLFLKGKLSYPLISSLQFALQFDNNLNDFVIHTCLHNSNTRVLKYLSSHRIDDYPLLKNLSIGFTQNYDKFYKLNKRITNLLPTIYSNDNLLIAYIKTSLIMTRSFLITQLLKIKLISP